MDKWGNFLSCAPRSKNLATAMLQKLPSKDQDAKLRGSWVSRIWNSLVALSFYMLNWQDVYLLRSGFLMEWIWHIMYLPKMNALFFFMNCTIMEKYFPSKNKITFTSVTPKIPLQQGRAPEPCSWSGPSRQVVWPHLHFCKKLKYWKMNIKVE